MADNPSPSQMSTTGSVHRTGSVERESLAGTLTIGAEDDQAADQKIPNSYSGIKTSTPAGSKVGSMEDLRSSRHSVKSQLDTSPDPKIDPQPVSLDEVDKTIIQNLSRDALLESDRNSSLTVSHQGHLRRASHMASDYEIYQPPEGFKFDASNQSPENSSSDVSNQSITSLEVPVSESLKKKDSSSSYEMNREITEVGYPQEYITIDTSVDSLRTGAVEGNSDIQSPPSLSPDSKHQVSLSKLNATPEPSAEIVNLRLPSETEFIASQIETSTLNDGRSVRFSKMGLGTDETDPIPSPPQILSNPRIPGSVEHHPSILRSSELAASSARIPSDTSARSILRDSKVSFQDVIKTHTFENDREGKDLGIETWKVHNGEKVNLEMPEFVESQQVAPVDKESAHKKPSFQRTDKGSSKSMPVLPGTPAAAAVPAHKSYNHIDEAVLKDSVEDFVQEVLKASQMKGKSAELSKEDVSDKDSFLSYTTPSVLLQKRDGESLASAESALMAQNQGVKLSRGDISERDSFMSYTTPSVLLQKRDAEAESINRSQGYTDQSRGKVSVAEVTSALLDCFNSEVPLKAASKQVIMDFVKEMKSIDKKTQVSTVSHPGFASVVSKLENVIPKDVSVRCRSNTLGYVSHPEQVMKNPAPKRPIVAGLKSKSLFNKSSPKESRESRQQASSPAFSNQKTGSQKAKSAGINGDSLDSLSTRRYDSEDFFASDEMSEDDDYTWEQWESILSYLTASISDIQFSSTDASSGSFDRLTYVKQPSTIGTDSGFIPHVESSAARELALLSPRSQQKAKMQNMVLVNQVIVDMENAVAQYKQNMTGDKGTKEEGSVKAKMPPTSCPAAEAGAKILPESLDPSPHPAPSQPLYKSPHPARLDTSPHHSTPISTRDSPQSVRTFTWSVSPIHSDTNLVIQEINNRLIKMKHEEQNPPPYPTKPTCDLMYSSLKKPESEASSETLSPKHDTKPLPFATTKGDRMESSPQYMYDKTAARPPMYSSEKKPESEPVRRDLSPKHDTQPLRFASTKGDRVESSPQFMYDKTVARPLQPFNLYNYLEQKTGASLPTSRVASPSVDQYSSGNRRKAASADVSRFLVEKEVLESQLRKMQVENSTLQTENKLLKEKHNRGQVRIVQLESQLRDVKHEAVTLTSEMREDMSAVTQRAQSRSEIELRHLQHKVTDLTAQLDVVTAQNASLKKLLDSSRSTNTQTTKASERSRIIESFKVENFCLKDELRQAKRTLEESERVRKEEVERRQEASAQIVRLTEVKALLQQQIEQAGGGSVAERQVRSLERRLKITEDRLHQERADRANKLSDMEERLINENARLQVAEKELKRQLTRERDKHKNIERKYKDLRDENERLRVLLAETNAISDNAGLAKLRGGNQKLIRDERAMLEDRIGRYKDTLEDVTKEKEQLETILRGRVKELTEAQHGSVAESRNLRDENAAIKAENEGLRCSLACPKQASGSNDQHFTTAEAQLESLRSRLRTAEGESAQRSREERLLESELGSVRTQLTAKTAALEEALSELERMHAGHLDGGDLLDVKQQQIDKLTAQVRGLQEDVRLWQEKVTAANTERSQLETHIDQLSTSKYMSKLSTDTARMAESDKLALETELHEKDREVLRLSVQYKAVEEEVQRTKQQLATSRQHAEQLSHQLDQLQTQLRQKTRMLERMTSAENDRGVQIKALRDNLTTANKELIDKTAQMRLLQVEHEQLNARAQRHEMSSPGEVSAGSSSGQLDTQQRLLEYERESARRGLDRANHAMNLIIQENSELLGRVRELRQDLLQERAQLCQLTSDKVEAEQQLHMCRDDKETLVSQRDRLQSDVSRLSADIENSILQLEDEAYRYKVDYETLYPTLNSDGKKVVIELGTVHRLLNMRSAEAQLYRDTIERQKAEIQSVNRRVELLQDEQRHNRDDIEGLTKELSVKMRENEVAVVSSQALSAEKTRLQMEKLQLEKDVGQGGSEMDRRLTEVHDLTSKLSKAESACRDAERQLHQKETTLVALETELKHVNRNNHTLESERLHLQTQLDKAKDETRDIRNKLATVEQQLNQEKNSLTEEKSSRDLLNHERADALRQVETLRHQVDTATANLDMERRNVHNLKTTLQQEEDKVFALEETVNAQRLELDTLRCHLAENRNTIDQHKKDKQTLYQDVQELCRKLADKDDTLLRLQEKCNETVDHLQKDFNTEKAWTTKEREILELDLAKTKEEMEELSGRLKQKDLQLEAYVRTSQELELERHARSDAESQLNKLESEIAEARQTLNTLQLDSSRKADHSKYTQENLEKAQTQVVQLKESMKTQREQLTTEINELRLSLTTATHKHDMERSTLQEKFNKALSDLRTKEVSLSSMTENKKSLHESSRSLEKTVESLRAQLHEEITGRKLAEQKNDSYKTQVEDLRSKRGNLDERYTELQATLARVETELNLEKDKYRRLKQEFSDEKSTSSTAEAHALVLHTQVTELQAEVSSLRSQLETQKQNLQGKNKRLTLDMKQQMENFDQERSKLVLQVNQLSSDVESVREQVATKNRDQLKLQEDVLSLEEQLREATSKNKHVTDALNMEEQHREKLELRNQELELKLRMRSDVDSESSKMDATRAEMNKMMSDMQQKMKEQMEQNKNVDKEAVIRQQKMLDETRKKVAVLESALNQEQAMHLVTKTQLSSLDEDNQRLRQQLQAARKRTTPSSDDKSKSRMEEINEIIARSQTRAQQMLASGAYNADDSMRESMRSSTRELLSPIPFVHHLNISGHSDNRSVASDDISRDLK